MRASRSCRQDTPEHASWSFRLCACAPLVVARVARDNAAKTRSSPPMRSSQRIQSIAAFPPKQILRSDSRFTISNAIVRLVTRSYINYATRSLLDRPDTWALADDTSTSPLHPPSKLQAWCDLFSVSYNEGSNLVEWNISQAQLLHTVSY